MKYHANKADTEQANIVILISVILCFISSIPDLATRVCKDISLFNEHGQIGDTIGGCTAPIIGVISIVLLCITLREQQVFNKEQCRSNEEQHFNDMFFNLLKEQRDIVHDLNGYMLSIVREEKYEMQKTNVKGVQFFQNAKENLRRVFDSLDLDSKQRSTMVLYELIGDKKGMYTSSSSNMDITDQFYGINDRIRQGYESSSIEKRIEIAYKTFYKSQTEIGHYFRHLYHILKWMYEREIEDLEKIGKSDDTDFIHKKYFQYARFIQAQMSDTELVLLFYDTFMFPKIKKFVIHYKLLDNLWETSLLNKEHNCFPEYNILKMA